MERVPGHFRFYGVLFTVFLTVLTLRFFLFTGVIFNFAGFTSRLCFFGFKVFVTVFFTASNLVNATFDRVLSEAGKLSVVFFVFLSNNIMPMDMHDSADYFVAERCLKAVKQVL